MGMDSLDFFSPTKHVSTIKLCPQLCNHVYTIFFFAVAFDGLCSAFSLILDELPIDIGYLAEDHVHTKKHLSWTVGYVQRDRSTNSPCGGLKNCV